MATLVDAKAQQQHALKDRIARCEAAAALVAGGIKQHSRQMLVKFLMVLESDIPAMSPLMQIEITTALLASELQESADDVRTEQSRVMSRFPALVRRACFWLEPEDEKDKAATCSPTSPTFYPIYRSIFEKSTFSSSAQDEDDPEELFLTTAERRQRRAEAEGSKPAWMENMQVPR